MTRLGDFEVIMFFWQDRAQTEGRRYTHLLVKTAPVGGDVYKGPHSPKGRSALATGGELDAFHNRQDS